MTHEPTPLRPAVHEGAFWLVLGASGQKLLGLLAGIALARLLYPVDFGVFALAGIAHRLAVLFDGAGTAQFVVVDREAERRLEAAHRINLVVAWALAAALALFAPLAARFFHEPRLTALLPVMGLALPFGAWGSVHGALLARELRLGAVARRRFAVRAGTVTLTVGLAAAGLGVWALAIPVPLHSLANSILNRRLHPWRPRGPARGGFRRVLAYGRHIVAARFASYLAGQLDNAVVGRALGAASLGLYDFAYQAAMMPLRFGGDLAQRLALPATASRTRQDGGNATDVFLAGSHWVALLATPLVLGLIVVARDWVLVLYGARWAETIPLIRLLAPAAFALLLARPALSWLQASGHEAWPARARAAVLPLLAVVLLYGVHRDLPTTARGVTAVLLLQAMTLLAAALGHGAAPPRTWALSVLRGALPGLLTGAAAWLLGGELERVVAAPAGRLAILIPAAGAVFVAAMALFARRDLREMWATARRRSYTPDGPPAPPIPKP